LKYKKLIYRVVETLFSEIKG